MADETNTDTKIDAPVKAAVKTETAKTETAKTATATKRAAKAKTVARPRRARKVTAKSTDKVVKAARKTNQRAATSARRVTKAAAAGAATQIERTSTMTNDFAQMFAGFQLPGSDKLQNVFADAGARSQELVSKSRNAAEGITEITKANVDAIAESGRIAAAGAKSIGQDVIASSRSGFEHASEAVRTLADAKSPTEFFQLQSEIVRSSFDRMVSETSKLTEQMVKLAGEAIQPISNRASVNAERVNELSA